ncbi:hypothetical protein HK096_006653 [Nowakowskiella sp. JEL0078]|nr:hypothetical protein HK096_006653 [Nowakowskiella sp. JEL0078]
MSNSSLVVVLTKLKELGLLGSDASVFKLIGPVLVKQDKAEADANVKKRIEFISAEFKRTESRIKELEEKQEKQRAEVIKLQQTYTQELN